MEGRQAFGVYREAWRERGIKPWKIDDAHLKISAEKKDAN
jgi:hypothetical protein